MQKEINFIIIALLGASLILALSAGVNAVAPGYDKWVSIITIGLSVIFGIRLRHVIEHDDTYANGLVSAVNALKAIARAIKV